jgi:hypothetical protein
MLCEYDPNRDIFIMNYADCKSQPTLAVTHFIQIPPTPDHFASLGNKANKKET